MLKGITDVWDEDLAGIVSDLEYEVLSKTSDTMNIYIVGFTDSIRNDIKDDVGKILVLSSIADNTDDKNLKKLVRYVWQIPLMPLSEQSEILCSEK